jgi:REP element-mobilizing transposase RayT
MPQSLSRILLHLIFSTKNRVPYFTDVVIRKDLHGYLAATANQLGCAAISIGGVADHVHVLCSLGRTISVATFVAKLKVSSNLVMRERNLSQFSWQKDTERSRYPNRPLTRLFSTCSTRRRITKKDYVPRRISVIFEAA